MRRIFFCNFTEVRKMVLDFVFICRCKFTFSERKWPSNPNPTCSSLYTRLQHHNYNVMM